MRTGNEAHAAELFEAVAELFFNQPDPPIYRYQRAEIVLWGVYSGIISEEENSFIHQYYPGSMFEYYPLEDVNQ